MAAADYRLMTEATGQRIAAALEALSGTGAAAAAARTNLDVYSKGETDNAIAQSTAKHGLTNNANTTFQLGKINLIVATNSNYNAIFGVGEFSGNYVIIGTTPSSDFISISGSVLTMLKAYTRYIIWSYN